MTNKRIEPPVVLQGNTMSDSNVKRTIESFLSLDCSQHSRAHATLPYIIDYCEKNRIPYKLTAYPGKGYFLVRIKELEDELY